MESFFKVDKGDLLFQNIKDIDDIKFEFIDKIGIFSQRINLNFYYSIEGIKLNLIKSFQNGIISDLKICIHIHSLNKINEIITDVNSLYNIHVYSEEKYLYILVKQKEILYTCELNNEKLNILSDYDLKFYLSRIVENTDFASSKHFITNEKYIKIRDVTSIIESNPIINQQWKIQAFIKDDNKNTATSFINLNSFFEKNKDILMKKSITFNQKRNVFIYRKIFNLEIIPLKGLKIIGSFCEIEFEQDMSDYNLYFAIRSRQVNVFNYEEYSSFKIYNKKVTVDFKIIEKFYVKSEDNIDILVGSSFENAKFITAEKKIIQELGSFEINSYLDGKFYVNGRNALSMYLKQVIKKKNNALPKVAVLGTCFSRNALNTKKYFNPEYKMYLECVFTQFHSRLDSINSKSAPMELIDQYRDHNEFPHIYRDMAKTFFEDLAASNAQVLVVDLYADALLKPLVLNNGSEITYNYLIKENNALAGYVKEWDQYRFITEEGMLEKWSESLHEFMDKVTKIIPESNIILNRGRLSEKFYENGELKEFGTIQLIKRNNYFWEKLDNIFVSNYPNAQIIDLTENNLYSCKNHPFGFSFSHYESEYYKAYFNELIKKLFLIKDKL